MRSLAVIVVLAAGVSLASCATDDNPLPSGSVDATSINRSNREPRSPADPGGAATTPPSAVDDDGTILIGTLSDPVPGLIRIDGSPSALAGRADAAFLATSTPRISQTASGESRAFQRLCVGEIDVVDSARPISPVEWDGCRAQGLDVVQFQVAADALVLAIKNETDVGGDCLDTDQVATIFGNGSGAQITTWSQVDAGFDDVALRAGGPDIDTGELRFFGRFVLGSPEPSLSDFAAGYRTFPDDLATRDFVVGSPSDLTQSRFLPVVAPRRERLRIELQQAQRVLDDARAEVALAREEQDQGIRDQRTPAARAADDERVRLAYAARRSALTQVDRVRSIYGPLDARFQRLRAAAARVDAARGTVGIFTHSYYALYEDLLRPFEIQVADDDGQPDCIFPSPQTIVSGQYPLSRRLLLTTTTRSLKRPEVADYLESYLRGSRSYAEAAQVVGLPAEVVSTQLSWIVEGTYPVLASIDGGPVEVQEPSSAGLDDPTAPPVERPAQ